MYNFQKMSLLVKTAPGQARRSGTEPNLVLLVDAKTPSNSVSQERKVLDQFQ
ncbi:hypothetical protein CA85_14160 [Allorhodopirellula solitaria]|uniref:Uncharacterized protein n=1 Tax=Allorhodopirellula solitaria TaxID=2527987 RepID=A0A5C5YF42_9BACT|nr:hypothetical protein CA85_14160 [Allorhodopirellula solitaria]